MATFTCDTCGYSKSAPDEWINRKAVCPKCKGSSIIAADEIVLAEASEFDESKTYAYKGDFLGMSRVSFLQRHDDFDSDEFAIVASTAVPVADYEKNDFERWMHESSRLIQYCAIGSRLSIVGFPVARGVFTFFDDSLASIVLTVSDPSMNTWASLLPEMHLALSGPTESTSVAGIQITTWKRPFGTLNLVYVGHAPSLNVRYVNLETLDEFNAERTRLTASNDL